jgi:retron-type reverse transcriptase
MPNPSLVTVLARAILAGEPTVEQIALRAEHALGRPWKWLRPLAGRYVAYYAGKTRPRHREVVKFLFNDSGFKRAQLKYFDELSIENWLTAPQQMQPVAAAKSWNVPAIESTSDLAGWLLIDDGELQWFADLRGLARRKPDSPKLGHYHYRLVTKRSGSIRLIESPKPRLKELQRQILGLILDRIPPHPDVHGFCKGRSIKTFAAPHVGQRVVLRMDIQDFFPSISGARIQALFRTVGYPEAVANLLGGICTNATPVSILNQLISGTDRNQLPELRELYRWPHLPQGAPTSPALANLCFYRVDCRLTGLANSVGVNYTRYADDLAFSGSEEFEKQVERFSIQVAAILLEEGFAVNHRKTRIMRQGVRQHLTGIVVNQTLNIKRNDFDSLKAILTNCIRFGPIGQNRDNHPDFRQHLDGRIGFVETINVAKGIRLRGLFQRIKWPEMDS